MTKQEINNAITNLEKTLQSGTSVYKLDDGSIKLETSYTSTDDILKAIEYFKRQLPEVE